jgi:glycosidase
MSSRRHSTTEPQLALFVVDSRGRLQRTEAAAMNPDAPDLAQFPYGAVVLPVADSQGNAVLILCQPGCSARSDVLILEAPARLIVNGAEGKACQDPRAGRQGTARVRMEMDNHVATTGVVRTNYAVVRFAAGLRKGERLSSEIRALLATVQYSIRAGDREGWFEYGERAFPDPAFRHGFPDIATREQGEGGIRAPSMLSIGVRTPIAAAHFAPVTAHTFDPGERVIYELHIGTFTKEGTFAAAVERLAYLRDKGVTTLQMMPIDVSSGPPGWTYDQTRTGAIDSQCYGGSGALIEFVKRAHEHGLEVIVDKQYNHRGPEQDSRPEIIPGMFARETIWGPGTSGEEAPHYPQIVKLIGEELAYWVSHYGIDGFRLDATNRLPWELHCSIADLARQTGNMLGKLLYLVSEYAECESPKGMRVPTDHQYTDQTGRYVMKMLGLSSARHVSELPTAEGTLMRPMLKAARRGWWYPDIDDPVDGMRGDQRATTLLWHHDWIGNRFGGERIHHLISFALFKTLAVWQGLGQWTPLIFMGTERYAETPWFYFTGHQDADARNATSAFYQVEGSQAVLSGGRFHEFASEALEAGLEEALAFSLDHTVAGIDWRRFREQRDRRGRPYMDHARIETFEASKIDWNERSVKQAATERLFEKLLRARKDDRVKQSDPRYTQYKAWEANERVFLLRRRNPDGDDLTALFNLGHDATSVRFCATDVDILHFGQGYVVGLTDADAEPEWDGRGAYSLWLDTNSESYGGAGQTLDQQFRVCQDSSYTLVLPGETALVYSRHEA